MYNMNPLNRSHEAFCTKGVALEARWPRGIKLLRGRLMICAEECKAVIPPNLHSVQSFVRNDKQNFYSNHLDFNNVRQKLDRS
nr:uncharacterized protein LOC114822866 isoform X2 [Malus domestica]